MIGADRGAVCLLILGLCPLWADAFGLPVAAHFRVGPSYASRSSVARQQVGTLALRLQAADQSGPSALPEADSFIKVCNAVLRKVDGNGAAGSDEVRGASLFADSAAVVFATRRPG